MSKTRARLIWGTLIVIIAVPIIAAMMSPQLAWRGWTYIMAGFAGIVAMTLLLVQPLLAGGYLPNLSAIRRRQAHRAIGTLLVIAVIIHVVGLWFTSPPDVIDALLFRSPTVFSAWGVIAMWTVFAAALLALLRRKLPMKPSHWRASHTVLATITVIGSVVHALLIEGTMETVSKATLCVIVLAVTVKLIIDLRLWNGQRL